MIAVVVHADVVLAGVPIPEHRMLEVVDDLLGYDPDEPRRALTGGEARALVQAGYAEPVELDIGEISRSLDGRQRA